MAQQRPLVILNGQLQQLPNGDRIPNTIVPEHNTHEAIQGGVSYLLAQSGLFQPGLMQEGEAEYYHLTSEEYANLAILVGGGATTLHSHAGGGGGTPASANPLYAHFNNGGY